MNLEVKREKNLNRVPNMELHSALTLLIIPVDQESSTLGLVREVPDLRSIQQKNKHWER